MTPSNDARDFIKSWEQCRLVRYNDSAGKPTIGWGHLITPEDGDIRAISQEKADALFDSDLDRTARNLSAFITCQPTQQQFDAVLDLAFNEGVSAIGNSTLMRQLNAKALDAAAYQFGKWIYVHDPQTGELVESPGLKKRRTAEANIFMLGIYDSAH